jgi:glycosyltransferase involved in cell wall biosynthesis
MTICDTGSTDNTRELVTEFFEQNKSKFKGILYNHEWKNFGYNRTLSLDVAKKTGATYILTIDADMIMIVKPGFKKKRLTADSYRLGQQHPNLFYYNTRLMRTKFNWRCVGVTHEYYDADRPAKAENLDTLLIMDLNDGGCKSDKFERDIRLLTQGLLDEPNNVRYMFYLAQSYTDIGDYPKGIEWYTKRINAGGWYEEIYYSYYRIGKIHELMNSPWPDIEKAYMAAWKFLPSRAEPLYELAKYCRNHEMHERGYKFAKIGSTIPFPQDQMLFISQNVYKYEIIDEMAICAYYIGKYNECINICERIIKDGHIPECQIPRIQKNIEFAKNKLDEIANAKQETKKKLIFYIGYSLVNNTDLYGSELALINLSKQLSKYYDVSIVGTSCETEEIDGVNYFNASELEEYMDKNTIEIMIVSRYIHYFIEYPIKAKRTYIWLHDGSYHYSWNGLFMPSYGKNLVNNLIDKIDGIICLTEWHKRSVVDLYKLTDDKVYVIGNGIDESMFEGLELDKVPQRFIYTSDVYRGLEQLVNYFHDIRKEFPSAELYIFRNNESFEGHEDLLHEIDDCPYIHYEGHLEHYDLMREFAKSDVWLYPTSYDETFCMSALEAMRSGCYCIATNRAALMDTIGDRGVLVNGDPSLPETKELFLNEVRKALTDSDTKNAIRNKAVEWAKTQTWPTIAQQWLNLIG